MASVTGSAGPTCSTERKEPPLFSTASATAYSTDVELPASSAASPLPSAMAEAMDSSTEVDLPAWAQPLKNAYVRDNFVHGFVSEQAQLELVLELQGRASLTEYVRR